MVSLQLLTNLASEPFSKVTLLPKRCLRKRLNTNKCQRCIDTCPSGALSFIDREIVLDESKCSGCMSCVSACPQDALVSDFDTEEVRNTLQRGGNATVSCVRQAQIQPDEIIVPCVGVFSKQLLTAIGVGGCGSVTFNVAGCSKCCNREISIVFLLNYRQVTEAFSQRMPLNFSLIQNEKQHQKPDVNRRAYLTGIRRMLDKVRPKSSISDFTTHSHTAKNSRRIPYKTQLVKNLVNSLDADSQKLILSHLGNKLSLNENCTCCPLCKGICPTGAITIERLEQGKKLTYEMLNCSGCGLCVEFCKKRALSLRPSTSPSDLDQDHFVHD